MSRGLMACLVLFWALLLQGCQVSHELTEEERAILVTEQYLLHQQGQAVAKGVYEKTVDYTSFATAYSYESKENQDVYVMSAVSVERTAANALTSEWSNRGGLSLGMSIAGLEQKEIPLTKTYGTRAKLALLTKEGKPVGNAFHAAIDKKIVTLIFVGVFYDKAEEFQKFIDPNMEQVSRFKLP